MLDELRTHRLLVRRWRPYDAIALAPVLAANVEHLGDWIPRHVSQAAAMPDLARRLAGFASAFQADTEWRYAIFALDRMTLLGEASLFSRDSENRVALGDADRAEIGYWLRADATGLGYATEATRALLSAASAEPAFRLVEIRCDSRNVRSAAVPRRLGFHLNSTTRRSVEGADDATSLLQIWRHDLPFEPGLT